MIPPEWLDQAARRLHGQIIRTPLTYDPELELYLKWENRQRTGSFKIRGALNKILSLAPWELQRGLVTASAGNHGQGVAYAAAQVKARATVFASNHAVSAKVKAMRDLGAEVRLVDGGYEAAERTAQAYALANGAIWVSPYNDGQVIAGQATIGTELVEQLGEQNDWVFPKTIYAPVGGGGLISGLGVALRRSDSSPRLVGAQSVASPFFHALFYAGSQEGVEELETIADGLSGAVEEGAITIPLVKRCVDALVLVTEEEIAGAIACAWHRFGEIIEGSAGAALAAAMKSGSDEKPAAVIISGGNIQPEVHAEICRSKPSCKFPNSESLIL